MPRPKRQNIFPIRPELLKLSRARTVKVNACDKSCQKNGLEWAAEWQPYTLIGDASWQNYDVSADILIETNSGMAFVMGRVGSLPGFSDALPRGYWLALNNGSSNWELHSSSNLLASGSAAVAVNTWHNLRLAMMGVF